VLCCFWRGFCTRGWTPCATGSILCCAAAIVPVVFILLIVKQPDLGTALVLLGVTAMMLLLAGMEWKYLAFVRAGHRAPLAALLFMVAWRRQRMLVFSTEADRRAGISHQPVADSRGHTAAFHGRGYMEGMRSSLSAEASTTLFRHNSEELGVHRLILIVILFVVWGARVRAAFRSRIHSRDWLPSHYDDHFVAGIFQHQRGAVAGADQGNSAALIPRVELRCFCTLCSVGVFSTSPRKPD